MIKVGVCALGGEAERVWPASPGEEWLLRGVNELPMRRSDTMIKYMVGQ